MDKKEKNKAPIFGLSTEELAEICFQLGLPKYAHKQIANWLYQSNISSIEEMTNLSKNNREILLKNFQFGLSPTTSTQVSEDGTKKYLFETHKGNFIESVVIPDGKRKTLCLSSQSGCRFACRFCLTGKMGFKENLNATEILNQYQSIPEKDEITNIVFMGMGEPLDNIVEVLKSLELFTANYSYAMSPTRITVSTIGLLPELQTILKKTNVHIAISLHSPFDEERNDFMPATKKIPLNELFAVIKGNPFEAQRRLSFEYILFEGINDSARHVNALVKLLHGMKCRMNIILFHPFEGSTFTSPSQENAQAFTDNLYRKGILSTLRKSRGQDIFAACGMLANKKV